MLTLCLFSNCRFPAYDIATQSNVQPTTDLEATNVVDDDMNIDVTIMCTTILPLIAWMLRLGLRTIGFESTTCKLIV